MAYMTMNVIVSIDKVITLYEVAQDLKEHLGWKHYELQGCNILFTDGNGQKRVMETSGNIYLPDEDNEPTGEPIEYFDLAEYFDVPDLVWAEDEDGNTVAIHN